MIAFSIFPQRALWLLLFVTSLSIAAPQTAMPATPSTLTFNVKATATRGTNTTQAMNAKVLLRGERVRVESQNGQQKVVMLWIKPYAYRLLPASKAGVRTRTKSSDSQLQGLPNWPQLLNNPARLRKALAAQGARKTGTATVNGVATDVYFAKNWQSMSTPAGNVKLQNVRIWLRRADALPVKMESKTGDWKIALTWNNYKRNPNLAASLFEVPKGYRIRETAGR